MAIAGFVVAMVSLVAAAWAAYSAWRSAGQSKRSADASERSADASERSADAAERTVSLMEEDRVKRSQPQLSFDTLNRRDLRIANGGPEYVTLVWIQFEGHDLTPCNDALDPPPSRSCQVLKSMPNQLLIHARESQRGFGGTVVVDDVRGERWEFDFRIDAKLDRAWLERARTLGRSQPA